MNKDWNFDEVVDRSNTASMKWAPESLAAVFGRDREQLLPLWVADMDFKCPAPVRAALEKRLAHPIYGYSLMDPAYLPALVRWYKRRHQWDIRPEWVVTTPGIVPALNYLIQCFSRPGDGVIIQPPVYYPFARAILNNGRRILENPLRQGKDHYEMDIENLEKKARDPRARLAVLCNPHNPVGRVWTRSELVAFAEVCVKNDLLLISDEIHCDLIMPGFKHTCLSGLSQGIAEHTITAVAASKTFNLAGLQQSSLIIPHPRQKQAFCNFLENLGFKNGVGGTLFGPIAAAAAYEHAEPWLDDLILYLSDNFIYLKTCLETELPGVRVFELQGTYLAWIDFRDTGIDAPTLVRILEEEAGVALDHGTWFGEIGAGFERINLACPRSVLKQALESMVKAVRKHLK